MCGLLIFRMDNKQGTSQEDIVPRQNVPPGCPYRFPPDDWVDNGLPLHKDPREFKFPIICNDCRIHANSLQRMRIHLTTVCPHGKRPNLTCGHCRYTTRSWPAMCAHLNQLGMQFADPCEPETGVDVAATTSSTLTLQLPLELSVVPQGETEDSSSGVHGLATSVRRGPRVARRITSPGLTAPDDIQIAMSRSSLPPPLPAVIVTSSSEELDDVEPDDPVGQASPPEDPGKLPSPAPLDFLGIVPGEIPDELLELEAAVSTSLQVAESPTTYTPQDFWNLWEEVEDQQDTVGAAGNLLTVDPSVLVVTPVEFSPVTLPVTDVPESALGDATSLSVEHPEALPQVYSADSSTEDAPQPPPLSPPAPAVDVKREPEDVVVISSPERETRSRSHSPNTLKRENRKLRRQHVNQLRELKFWADTVKTIGNHCPRPPTKGEKAARRKLVASGAWPETMEGLDTASFRELGSRFSDMYGHALHHHSS